MRGGRYGPVPCSQSIVKYSIDVQSPFLCYYSHYLYIQQWGDAFQANLAINNK